MGRDRTAEHRRLADSEARRADWKNWGPYVSERAWGTVREDYSADGEPWDHFPHEHARSRAYRWNEDGLGGFCNRFQNLCTSLAVWNGKDPFLKERLFGLAGNEGNHGEDVKEIYFYLDGTPTHSYMKMLYRYPQAEYPYASLLEENRRRGHDRREFELLDALQEDFAANRFFDVTIEYAKADQEDILCRVSVVNQGPDPAPIHVLPHLWFRNTWSWGYPRPAPRLFAADGSAGVSGVQTTGVHLGQRFWYAETDRDEPPALLFTENDTNVERLFDGNNPSPFVKDGIHEAVVHGRRDAVNPQGQGTKVAGHVTRMLEPGETLVVRTRLSDRALERPFAGFEATVQSREREADEFYDEIHGDGLSDDEKMVQRQAFAGLLWTKQFYHYGVELWLDGDPAGPEPSRDRRSGRNAHWTHLYNVAVISMPDKWEYPWYAAWDLAFHTVPLALIDPEWAKRQLVLMLREWYMHPNGQLPAYEWNLSDVNPPVHAWAAWRVYKITRNVTGKADTDFLERVFHKLLLNFTWWVNRKDTDGRNIFEGGFLGLDNIGVFDRSASLPTGGHLEQADGTAWMGMYCLNMLAIALELASTRPAYEDVATKFFEHFVYIADAINRGCADRGLWNEEDGFYNDILHIEDGNFIPLEVRSFVGLIPLFAVETIEPHQLARLPRFRRRMEWFLQYRPKLLKAIPSWVEPGEGGRRLLSIVDAPRLRRMMARALDEEQFLSPHGLRSLSREHLQRPYTFTVGGEESRVQYDPAESTSGLFGGNSNWRGPIWFPLNYLMIESLQKFHHYYGDRVQVEMPVGSGHQADLSQVAEDLSQRMVRLFLRGPDGRRPFNADRPELDDHPLWRDRILFHEYFHGDTGAGLGASHQTGWTALVAKLIRQSGGNPI